MTIGNILYYICWPLLWFYSPLTARVRVIIKHKNEILVVKNWFGSGHWQLPGGGIKMGERPLEAAVREIKEELDVTLNEPKLLTDEIAVFRQFGLLKRNHFVLSELKSKPKVTRSKEISSFKWVDIKDFDLLQQIESKLQHL